MRKISALAMGLMLIVLGVTTFDQGDHRMRRGAGANGPWEIVEMSGGTRVGSASTSRVLPGRRADSEAPAMYFDSVLLRLGDQSTVGSELFAGVAGAVWVGDASIAVLDHGNSRVAIFGQSGTFQQSFGRAGEGPGEFIAPTWVGACRSDALLIADGALPRLTEFSLEGEGVRVMSIPRRGRGSRPAQSFACSEAGEIASMSWPNPPRELGEGPYRNPVDVDRLRLDEQVAVPVGRFDGSERYMWRGRTTMPSPLGPRTFIAVYDSTVFVGDGSQPRILAHRLGGAVDTIPLPLQYRPVARRDVEHYVNIRTGFIGDRRKRARVRGNLVSLVWPKKFPAFTGMVVGHDGMIWVREGASPVADTVQWYGVTRAGKVARRLVVPHGHRIQQIRRGRVLTIWTDPNTAMEVVEVWAIRDAPTQEG